jgi:hypothetical protein
LPLEFTEELRLLVIQIEDLHGLQHGRERYNQLPCPDKQSTRGY